LFETLLWATEEDFLCLKPMPLFEVTVLALMFLMETGRSLLSIQTVLL
jgi:hypothetical protein